MAGLRQRKDVLSLSAADVGKLTAAMNTLKTNGTYDDFVRRHVLAMNTPTPPGSQSNGAHSGPIFLAWHRAFLWEFESALLAVDPTISGVPYWRWEVESSLNGGDPSRSTLWTDQCMGGNGDSTQGYRVLTGPFRTWQALIYNNTTGTFQSRSPAGILRRFGGDAPTLPDQSQVTDANTYTSYDVNPYAKDQASFRGRMEGWSGGPRMHNQVHRWISGDMVAATSPNDPVFWLHHGNIDRIWWLWQSTTTPRRPYAPISPSGPVGQRSDDTMVSLLRADWTPATVQDIQDTARLGYQYI